MAQGASKGKLGNIPKRMLAIEALRSTGTKTSGFEVGITCSNEFSAERNGFETVAGKISSKTRADYYLRGMPMRVKLVVDA